MPCVSGAMNLAHLTLAPNMTQQFRHRRQKKWNVGAHLSYDEQIGEHRIAHIHLTYSCVRWTDLIIRCSILNSHSWVWQFLNPHCMSCSRTGRRTTAHTLNSCRETCKLHDICYVRHCQGPIEIPLNECIDAWAHTDESRWPSNITKKW